MIFHCKAPEPITFLGKPAYGNDFREDEELESCPLMHDSAPAVLRIMDPGWVPLGKMCVWGRKMPGERREVSCAARSKL